MLRIGIEDFKGGGGVKIAVGADHRGFERKEALKIALERWGHAVEDVGTHGPESCDYPEIAHRVAERVGGGKAERGILVCKSGHGMAIVANKSRGVRAALCGDRPSAVLSRQHNDANVLVLPGEQLGGAAEDIVRAWLEAPFEGGRHLRRVEQIAAIEKRVFK
jgi:ribose 5-phosphate isomerase B